MKNIMLASVLFLVAATAEAQDWYAALQYSSLDVELSALGATADSEPDGISLLVGRMVNENFAVEGLVGMGLGDDRVENSSFDFELESVLGLSVVGIYPASDALNLYGKIGFALVEYDDSDGDASDASGVMFGLGAAFAINEQYGLNIEYVQYPDGEYDDFDIDVEASALNLGGYYRF